MNVEDAAKLVISAGLVAPDAERAEAELLEKTSKNNKRSSQKPPIKI